MIKEFVKVMLSCCAIMFLGLSVCGCGPQTTNVSGKVTLNGKPLANHIIHFEPKDVKDSLRKSAKAITNEKGEYTLVSVLGNKPGCPVGPCHVRIGYEDPNPKMVGSEIVYHSPVTLPNTCSDGSMIFTVPKEGTTKANFDLSSK